MSKELSTKHKWIIAIAILLSVVAITLSIVSICKTYPTQNQGLDYWGLILGVLALLITILVGWQIFSIINFQSAQKEIQDAKTSFQKAEEEIKTSRKEIVNLHDEARQLKDEAQTYYNINQLEIKELAAKIHSTIAISYGQALDNRSTAPYIVNITIAIQRYCELEHISTANILLEHILNSACETPTILVSAMISLAYDKLKDILNLLDANLVQKFMDLYNVIHPIEIEESNKPIE